MCIRDRHLTASLPPEAPWLLELHLNYRGFLGSYRGLQLFFIKNVTQRFTGGSDPLAPFVHNVQHGPSGGDPADEWLLARTPPTCGELLCHGLGQTTSRSDCPL